ncbi:hypothetical protein DFH09DRAFT_1318138 [Mycena vulgaris]|nr:hypothetical protein DFH09DRAFT_1318138 [Mycena vulgaris]
MPLINNSTGLQIHGGIFYEVSGDVNLEQHLTAIQEQKIVAGVGPPTSTTVALDDGWHEGSGRDLSGVVRDPHHGMNRRHRAGRRAQADVKFPISERTRWAASLATEVLWIAFNELNDHDLSTVELSSLRRT